MSLSQRPGSNGSHSVPPESALISESKKKDDWIQMLTFIGRENLRGVWEGETTKFPMYKINPAFVLICDLEEKLFPEHKLTPEQCSKYENMIVAYEKDLEKTRQKYKEVAPYATLLLERMDVLRKHLIQFIL